MHTLKDSNKYSIKKVAIVSIGIVIIILLFALAYKHYVPKLSETFTESAQNQVNQLGNEIK